MSAILFGVPGKLKTLLGRIPLNNTTLMGRLNDTITSRAPADTAVLNTVLTTTRAGLLDNLDASILSRQSEANALARYNDLNGDIGNVKTKTDYIPSALTSGTTDTTRYTALINEINGSPTYSSVIKNIHFKTFSRTGAGASFSSTFTAVDPDKTILIPQSFIGPAGNFLAPDTVAAYEFSLDPGNRKVKWIVRVQYTNAGYTAGCYVVEFH